MSLEQMKFSAAEIALSQVRGYRLSLRGGQFALRKSEQSFRRRAGCGLHKSIRLK